MWEALLFYGLGFRMFTMYVSVETVSMIEVALKLSPLHCLEIRERNGEKLALPSWLCRRRSDLPAGVHFPLNQPNPGLLVFIFCIRSLGLP